MKNSVPLSVAIPVTTWFKVDQLAEALDLTRSHVFDLLIRHGLDTWTKGEPLPDAPPWGSNRAAYNVRLAKTTYLDLTVYHRQVKKESLSTFCCRLVELALRSWEFDGMSTFRETATTPVYLRGSTYGKGDLYEMGEPVATGLVKPELTFEAEDAPRSVGREPRKTVLMSDVEPRVMTDEEIEERRRRRKGMAVNLDPECVICQNEGPRDGHQHVYEGQE